MRCVELDADLAGLSTRSNIFSLTAIAYCSRSVISAKVADLTVDEFRSLVQEIVVHTLSEMLGNPDEGAELREDFAKELRSALVYGRKQQWKQLTFSIYM